jgi:dolichol-phosphate mannosyltransferase
LFSTSQGKKIPDPPVILKALILTGAKMKKNHKPRKDTDNISVVIPLYNEEKNINPLLDRLINALEEIGADYEIILVDDGSKDATWEQIFKASKIHPTLIGLKLSRNFGHQGALLAGMTKSRGKAIVTMDGDLQHPPEIIPEMYKLWIEGAEVVNAIRINDKTTSQFKRFTSEYFYKLFSFLSDVELNKGSSDFRLIDRRVLENFLDFKDYDLFIRGAITWLGFNTMELPFITEKRRSGMTKFSLAKMFRFATGAIVSFSTKPLKITFFIGIVTSGLAFAELIYVIIQYFMGNTVSGWASTLAVICFLFGVLFIILGILGIYLARVFNALQNRPRYVVSQEVGNSMVGTPGSLK